MEHQAVLRSYGVPTRPFGRIPTYSFQTFEEDIALVAERLAEAGMERVFYVDLSLPELPVRVARVVVPGLEGVADTPGYVPGARALARDGRKSA